MSDQEENKVNAIESEDDENNSASSLFNIYQERLYKYQTLIIALAAATIAYDAQQISNRVLDESSTFLILSTLCCAISIVTGLKWMQKSLTILMVLSNSKNKADSHSEIRIYAAELKSKKYSNYQYGFFLSGVIFLGLSILLDLWMRSLEMTLSF